MDDYYCSIRLYENKSITLFLFHNNIISYKVNTYPICFTASSISLIHMLLSKHHYFKSFSVNHILYIGQELYKAELSLMFDQVYVQN
uniref:hypothetical protein n=1 Tax=Polyopes affinis TaxID=194519 RepID=UPI002A802809|nr:hypothetical protein NDC12_pgp194 [Polyopes affinis]WOL36942.1 hypothetical protein [Polyopes affinis]